ncbi:MAG: hypothetical protein MH137_05160 [Flavobacteriales bacterium]|nr:hypothetical protein [Flavobacteriales bacterium]
MGIQIIYKPLFEIRFLHHYFLDKGGKGSAYKFFDSAEDLQAEMLAKYNISNFMEVLPDDKTREILRKNNCVCRNTKTGIIILTKVTKNETGKYVPESAFSDNLKFRFGFKITDQLFLNYTNLPFLKQKENKIYFFENKSESEIRLYPNLHKKAEKIKLDTLYNDGEILVNQTDSKTLIAEKITIKDNKPEQTFTEDFLVNNKPIHYVNANDLISYTEQILRIDTGKKEISSGLKIEIKNYKNEQITPKTEVFEDGNTIVQIDFKGFQDDIYKIKISKPDNSIIENKSFYVFQSHNTFNGIIQINIKSDNTLYNVLDDNNVLFDELTKKTFEIRFKNRATTWRYVGKKFQNTTIEHGPHLLTKSGFVSLSIKNEHGDDVIDPENPAIENLKIEKQSNIEKYNLISEIFINS